MPVKDMASYEEYVPYIYGLIHVWMVNKLHRRKETWYYTRMLFGFGDLF